MMFQHRSPFLEFEVHPTKWFGCAARIFGSVPFIDYIGRYDIPVVDSILDNLGFHQGREWQDYVHSRNEHMIPEDELERLELFDIMDRMLTIDHTKRITARDAIYHPFFDEMRDTVF